ncbi:MAG TPA: type II toxin-antitoxin system RelE/ParE family toxin [Hyphomicrobiaceae bacterium]|jgi:proteic killer suppression protein
MPIRRIRHKGLRRLFEKGEARGVPAASVDRLRDMLLAIDTAEAIGDLDVLPGWRLHPLKGELAGRWSLTVTGNWRLTFRFEDGDALDLDLVDYH